MPQQDTPKPGYLKRLPVEYYEGHSTVHWTMSISERKTGWLDPEFHAHFRELLLHTSCRHRLCVPVYCIMLDHFHCLWMGFREDCHQRNAAKFFRKYLNEYLQNRDPILLLQKQAYDHVLKGSECQPEGMQKVAEYIAHNPVRKKLILLERVENYTYTSCLMPGYPKLSYWQDDYWEVFYKLLEYKLKTP